MPKKRGNGEGSVVKYKDRWRAIIVTGWRDRTHPIRHTRTFATAKEARSYISSFQNTPSSVCNHTLTDYWNVYENNGLLKLSSSKQTHYRTVWRRLEEVANEEVGALTVARLQEVVKGYTYYPAKDMRSLLSHLFKLAIADGACSINLSSSIVLPELHEEETVPFSADEVERMWADYEEHPETGVALLMTYTGLMPGEVVAIKRSNIQGQVITGAGLKTDRRRQNSVVIPDRLMPVVEDLLERGKKDGLLPYKMDTYRKEFKRMVERIGADARCTPYSCRHTFATMLATQVPAHVLARLMRNDIRVTAKYYLHNDDEVMLNEVNKALGTN